MRRAVLAALLGLAVAAPGAHAAGTLPDIVSDPPENAGLETYSANGTERLLLRFDSFVRNAAVGTGPQDSPWAGALDVRAKRVGGVLQVRQDVYDANGQVAQQFPIPSEDFIYETADGHNHFHLQHVARYSLWREDRSAEVAPSVKSGFCLKASEDVTNQSNAYYYSVYGWTFCGRDDPSAASVMEGIQPGYRDIYRRNLTFQWVDVSDVAPGRYVVRSDVDPDGIVAESNEANNAGTFAASTSVIPGYIARPAAVGGVSRYQATAVALDATSFGTPGARRFRVVTAPAHGSLDVAAGTPFAGPQVVYTPDPRWRGDDSFSFVALDAGSPYPRTPAAATVALTAAASSPRVAIGGLPASLATGTSAQLRADVVDDLPQVTWSASAGSVTADGLYTAPGAVPPGGSAVVTATSPSGASDQRTVQVVAPAAPSPAPLPPTATTKPSTPKTPSAQPLRRLQDLTVGRVNGWIVVRVVPGSAGTVRLSATALGRALGSCRAKAVKGRAFTCRLRARRGLRLSTVRATASLRVGARVVAVRRAQPKPAARGAHAHP